MSRCVQGHRVSYCNTVEALMFNGVLCLVIIDIYNDRYIDRYIGICCDHIVHVSQRSYSEKAVQP